MAPTYRYIAYDLLTNTAIAELGLTNVRFTKILNRTGTFYALLPIADSRNTIAVTADATAPLRTVIFVERNGVLIFGALIWLRTYHRSTRKLEIRGNDLFSYLNKRIIGNSLYFRAGVDDIFDQVSGILDYLATIPNGDIGLTLDPHPAGGTGQSVTRTFSWYDVKFAGEAINQLSDNETSFDYTIEVGWGTNGFPEKKLSLWYPNKGVKYINSGLTWEMGKNIIDYDWPEDASQTVVQGFGIGAGDGIAMIESVYRNDNLGPSYPVVEDFFSWKDISVLTTLQAHTKSAVDVRNRIITNPTIDVKADIEPAVGSWNLGDEVRIRIVDDRWPRNSDGTPSLDVIKRIQQYELTPGNEGQEVATVTLGDIV